MPAIRPLSDMRNNIGEITQIVDEDRMPVFLTKHGKGKYVFLSMDEYDRMSSLHELYMEIDKGLYDIRQGRTRDFSEAMKEIRKDIADGNL